MGTEITSAVVGQAADPVSGAAGSLAQGIERFGVVYILCAVIVALALVVVVLWRKVGQAETDKTALLQAQIEQNKAAAELTKKLADGQIDAMRGEIAALRATKGVG